MCARRSLLKQDSEHDKHMYLGLRRAEDWKRDFEGSKAAGESPSGANARFALMNDSLNCPAACPPFMTVARCPLRRSAWDNK